MKFKDLFYSCFLNIFRQKKNNLLLIVVVFCSLIVFLTSIVYSTFNYYIVSNYEKNIGFRILNVFTDDVMQEIDESKLLKIDHVIEVFNSNYYSFSGYSDFKNDNYNGLITLLSNTENMKLEIVKGKSFDGEVGKAICPVHFFPDSMASDINSDMNIKHILKGDELLGKKFEIFYSKYDVDENNEPREIAKLSKRFEIVGLYDSTANMTNLNQCFVSLNDIKEIVDDVKIGNTIASTYVFVDKLENIDEVVAEINELGYSTEISSYFDQDMVSKFNLVCLIISTISVFVVVIILVLYIRKKVLNDSQNMGVLRSIGYSQQQIRKKTFFDVLLTLFITYCISLIIFFVLYFILKNYVINFLELYNIRIIVNFSVFLISFIVIIIMPFLFSIFDIYSKTNTTIISLMRMEE